MRSIDTSFLKSDGPRLRPRFRFGMRALLIFMAAVCVILALGPYKARRYDQRKARAQLMIVSLGGTVQESGSSQESSPGTNWISLRMGYGERRESRWRVDVSNKSLSDDQLKQLGECNWIRTLDLSGSNIRDESLKHIANIRKLRELSLAETGITDSGLAKLKPLERLYLLDVRNTTVTYAGLAELDRHFPCANFQEQLALSRTKIPGIAVHSTNRLNGGASELDMFPPPRVPSVATIHFTNSNLQLTPQNIDDLRHLASVRTVLIGQGIRPPDGESLFSNWHNLESASLSDTRDHPLTEDDLLQVAKLPKLKQLILYSNLISDVGVAHLAGAHQLQTLSILGGTDMTPASLIHLRNLNALQNLTVAYWRAHGTSRDLQASVIAREDLKHLAALPSLRQLRILGDQITDEVVPGLAELKSLETLELDGRYVSDGAAKALQTELPNCTVMRSQR